MTLVAHVAAHPDQLVEVLCDGLVEPHGDPFAPELIAVPTRGIERWLTQRLSVELAARGAGDGICANIDFPSPGRLVWDTIGEVPELAAAAAAWEGPALTAHLAEAIDHHRSEPWMAVLSRHLDDTVPGNRLAAAEKIARLFARYGRRRPEMMRAWAAGDNVAADGSALPARHAWQPLLWRAVRDRIGEPSLPELLPEALAPLTDGTVDLDLPERISVYGLTAADPLDLQVLAALATHRRIDLYVLHPSPSLWRHVADETHPETPPHRIGDPGAGGALHPILRSWAQDSRELQQVLAGFGITASPAEPVDRRPTLLGTLQEDILHNRAPTAAAPDATIQVHVCHGPRRQVEVMRDAVLHVLAADPTLQPRDIVIMTPDLATFAPLIEAAFPTTPTAAGPDGGIPDLRVRIADRSPAATNPLVRFAATVLDIADGRLETAVVRDLVSREVVRQRFGFDADTAGDVDHVLDDARVAWGFDGDDRARWMAGSDESRTWRRGLDRALAGVFYADSAVGVVGDTVPLHGVEGQDARPIALLAALLDRIAAIRRLFGAPMPRSRWATALATSVRMLAETGWDEEWQWGHLERRLGEAFPTTSGADPLVDLAEARRTLAHWTDDRPSALHFRTGDVTVCTLVPMRSVPYRVVCLLGMDDGRFPRSSRRDGDDLLADDERVGDHDRGAEDRQLLLDAAMAAGDALIVTYSGRDQLTNDEYPPAVPVSELLDVVAAMTGEPDVDRIGPPVVTQHPLQSFSGDNFTPGALGRPGAWGFDPAQLAAAEAAQRRTTPSPPTPSTWPAPLDEEVISLDRLIRFLEHPARGFLDARVGVTVPSIGDLPDDTVPADLSSLQRWAVTDRLLSGLVSGHPIDQLADRERRSDALPPGALGEDDLDDAIATAQALWQAAADRGYDPSTHHPVAGIVTAAGRAVEGSVLVDPHRHHLFTVSASKVRGRQRLRAYAQLLFATAAAPDTAWTSVLVGRRDSPDGGIVVVTAGPIKGLSPDDRAADALARLGTLVELYVEGHHGPLPLPCDTGYTWQRRLASDAGKAATEAAKSFESRFGDANDLHHRLAAPTITTFATLRDAGFEDYSERLWLPYLTLCREASA